MQCLEHRLPGPRHDVERLRYGGPHQVGSRQRGESGRVLGPPLPAGPAPWRLAAGSGGRVLTLSMGERRAAQLTHIAPDGDRWATRTLAPDALGVPAHQVLLAGDGGRYAVAAYPTQIAGPAAPPCRLAVLDLVTGAVVRTQVVCTTAREALYSLALENTDTGSVAHIGLWRAPEEVNRHGVTGSSAIVAIQADTGAVVGRTGLAGVPEHLVLAAAPGQVGQRLYCVEGTPGPEVRNARTVGPDAGRWRLVGLNPVALEVESALPLSEGPVSVAVAPDGSEGYVVPASTTGLRSTLLQVDLRTGQSRPLIVLPGQSVGGLVVTGERVYVPHSLGSAVWAVDRRHGRLAKTIAVGRHPLDITLAHP